MLVLVKKGIKNALLAAGFSLVRINSSHENKDEIKHYNANVDVGRDYQDNENVVPNFKLKKSPPLPWADAPTEFLVFNGESHLKEIIYYSHLTLLKMCKDYQFNTVLDIGSHERRCTRVFEHIGKKVTTIEIAPSYEADYRGDYLDQKFEAPFDAIWCSQTYEHQRNPGIFLDKIFDDLKEGGVLGLTVPFQTDHSHVAFGHLNLTSPLMLIYHLVCAGFDCKDIALKVYNGFIGVVLIKRYNGIKRGQAFGSLPLKGQSPNAKEIVGDEIFDKMDEFFPFPVAYPGVSREVTSINWGDPI